MLNTQVKKYTTDLSDANNKASPLHQSGTFKSRYKHYKE